MSKFLFASALALALVPTAQAELLTNYGSWSVDRFDPSGFSSVTSNGRSNVLKVDIAGADVQSGGTFYNNQGRGTALTAPQTDYAVIYGSLWVPSTWGTSTGASDGRSTALWAFSKNSANPADGTQYSIVGFSNAGADTSGDTTPGTGRMRVFDGSTGAWTAASTPIYDAWNNVCMVLAGGKIDSYVNGTLAYSQADLSINATTADQFTNLIVNTYNNGADYSAEWSNLGAGKLTAVVASSGGGQAAAVGSAFSAPLVVEARDASGAPLPCVPVTFTVPASGASTTLASTTVMTDYLGRASVTATANGTAGSYAVTASAPGVEAPVSLNLTNAVAPVPTVTAVPTLGEWALIAMSMLLGTLGLRRMRRSV